MADNNYKIKIGYDVDTSGLKNIDALKKILTEISNMRGISDKNIDVNQLKQASDAAELLLKALKNSENVDLGKINLTSFDSTLRKAGTSLNSLTAQLSGSLGKTGVEATQRLNQELALTGKYAIKSNKFIDDMYSTLVKTAKWNISSSIINNIQGSFQRAFGYIEDLDESLTNIRIVTGASADEMGRFTNQANIAAKALGQSTLAYSDAALIYYQQGKGSADVEKLTDVTLKAANVSQSTAEDMSNYLTAVWNGYKITAENAEATVDGLSAVAATTGADLSELAIGMSKVASAANTMGVDMNQMNAILSTITTVTREAPETVGTSLKTVLARMTDLSLGKKDEDGMDFGQVEKDLNTLGLSMLNENGQLKDMGDAIEEVGNKWTTFSKEQQIALSQSMAGTRQYSRLIALFDNWDMYKSALKTSENSLGTLEEQNKVYLESFEAHANELTASLEGLWSNLIDSNTLKDGIDILSGFVNGVDGLVDGLGGVGPVLTLIGTLMLRAFSGKIAKNILDTKNNILGLINGSKEVKNMQSILNNIATGDSDTLYAKQNKALIDYVTNAKNNYRVMTEEQKADTQAKMQDIVAIQDQIAALKQKRLAEQSILDAADNYANTSEFDNVDIQDFIMYTREVVGGYDEMGSAARDFVRSLNPEEISIFLKQAEDDARVEMKQLEKIYQNANLNLTVKPNSSMSSELQTAVNTLNATEKGTDEWKAAITRVNVELKAVESRLAGIKTLSQSADVIADKFDLGKASAKIEVYDAKIEELTQDLNEMGNAGNASLGDLDSLTKLTQATESISSGLMAGTSAASLLNQALSGTASGSDILISTLTTAGTTIGTLGIMAKMAGIGLGSFLTTATGGLYLLVMAIPVAITIFDKLIVTEKEAKENASKLREEYKSLQGEIESLNNELKTTNDRIEELNNKEHLTLVEEDELEKLKTTNDELEREVGLKEALANSARQDSRDAAVDILNKKNNTSIESFITNTAYGGGQTYEYKTANQVDDITAAEEKLKKINELKKTITKLNKDSDYLNGKNWEDNQAQIKKSEEELKNYETAIKKLITDIDAQDDALIPGQDDEAIAKINNVKDAFIAYVNGVDYNVQKLEKSFLILYDAKGFEDAKAKLEDLVRSGKYADDEFIELIKTDKEYKTLLQSGLTPVQVLQELKALTAESDSAAAAVAASTIVIKTYKEVLDDVAPKASMVAQAQVELKKSGVLSYETVSNLLEAYPELEKQLTHTADGYKISKSALDDLRTSELSEYKLNLNKARIAAIEVYNSEVTKQNAYKNTMDSIESVIAARIGLLKSEQAEAKSADIQAENKSAGMSFGMTQVPEIGSYFVDMYQSQIDTLQSSLDSINQAKENVEAAKEAWDAGWKTGTDSATSKGDKDKSIFKQQIDWVASSLENLKARIEDVNSELENTTSLDSQIDKYKELIKIQTTLEESYSNAASKYEVYYTTAMSMLTKAERAKYKPLIEGMSSFSIETFYDKAGSDAREKDYNIVVEAQKYYKMMKENQKLAKDTGYTISDLAKSLASVRWDKAGEQVDSFNKDIDVLNGKLDNHSNWKTQNYYLDEIVKKQKSIVKSYAIAVRDLTTDTKDAYDRITGKSKLKDTKGGKIEYGDYISTKGVIDPDQITAIEVYNNSVKQLKENVKDLAVKEQDLQKIITDTAQQKFDNINAYYENRTAYLSDQQGLIDNQVELSEARGFATSKKYIEKKIAIEQSALDYNQANLLKMQATLDNAVKTGNVKEYSSAWYDMAGEIYATRDEIDQSTIAMEEFNAEINDMNLKNFEGLIEKINTVTSEANFLINLMSENKLVDENGGYTDTGIATQGLHAQNYDTYLYEAEEYKRKLAAIDAELAKAENKNNIKLLAERQTYIEGVQSSIESAESEKKAMIDLAQQGIQADIDATTKLIEVKKDALDIEQKTAEYQESINEKTKNIATIQKRINALEGNNTESNRRKLQELKAELADAQKDLDKTTSDKNIELQKEGYDKDIEDITKTMKEYSEDTEQLFDDTMKKINNSSVTISKTLGDTAKDIGYTISDEIAGAWDSSTTAVNNYSTNFTTAASSVSTMLGILKTNYEQLTTAADKYAKASISGVQAGNTNVSGAQLQVPKASSILGTSSLANVLGNTGGSELNDYAASLGYGTLSYQKMFDLAQTYGISSVTSKDDFINGPGAAANKQLVLTALQADLSGKNDMRRGLIDQILGTPSVASGKSNDGGSILNKELAKLNYGAVNTTEMLQLARILKLYDIDTLDEVKYGTSTASTNSQRIWNALKEMKGFSRGGIATSLNDAITRNGDEGITTVTTGETILTDSFTKLMPLSVELMKQLNNSNVQRSLASLASYSLPDFSGIAAAAPNITVDVNTPLINVENMDEDMLYKLQNDKTIQRTIQDMTIGQMTTGAYNAGARW